MAFEHASDRGSKLREAGAEGDDREADDRFGDAQLRGDAAGGCDERLRADDEEY